MQNRLVQRQVCDNPLEPCILTLQLFQPSRLIHLQSAIFLAPLIQRLLCNADLATGFDRRPTATHNHIYLAQLWDDLFRRKTLTSHMLLEFL